MAKNKKQNNRRSVRANSVWSPRDTFALHAMQAIVKRCGVLSCIAPGKMNDEQKEVYMADENAPDMVHIGTAVIAYQIADAMLAARNGGAA